MNNQKDKKVFIQCPLCNCKKLKKVFKKKWNDSFFVKCIKCNLIFQNPQESKLKTIKRYNSDYFQYELENQDNFFNLIKITLDSFRIFNLIPHNSEVLEVGSATGLFLKYMDSKGYKSTGVELCKESVEYGVKEYGVNLLHGTLENLKLENNFYDFIHFSHLIEHLNDPFTFLKTIYDKLKPYGYAMITTPNSSGLFSGYFKESWRCIVDDHLFIFNKNNLRNILEKCNFKIIDIKTWGSIPRGIGSKRLKSLFDKFVKIAGLGDVVCLLVQKPGFSISKF